VKAQQAEASAQQAEQRAAQVEARAQEAEAKAQKAQQRASLVEARAREAEIKARHAEERAAQAEATLKAVFSSRSWRVTAPLRRLASAVRPRREKANASDLIGASFDNTSTSAQQAEQRVAQAEATLQAVFSSRSWRVTAPLRRLASAMRPRREKANASDLIGASFDNTLNWSAHSPSMTVPRELMELSPRAREIYFQLKAALEKNQENK
jgi:hypothetical protein